ncbi:reverse transcriptase domain-containing protein [Clostridium aestuarii]|uniref:Reverse transcriptase domain-containing protein n=1 Tax=Clostridium aestuarii TaxID=338193 RepID=A0ABT4D2K6_9CLOT|nr:reverse transcriptase domain-containing protein [Clostridium aestuarii]
MYKGRDEKGRRKKVYYVRYCDDFIITADKKEILENEIKPQISKFLSIRGLELSKEKTLITHIEQGFNFLGFNIKKVKNKLLIRPSKENVKRFLKEIKAVIKQNKTAKQENLINILNPKIRGWANYYRHVVSRKTYEKVDAQIWIKLYKWAYRRHPNKGKRWCVKRYFYYNNGSNWSFQAVDIKERLRILYKCTDIKIIRHKLIRDNANPYDSEWRLYFEEREGYRLFESVNGQKALYRIWKNQNGICPICNTKVTRKTGWKIHIKDKNKVILHPKCHRKIHSE